MAKHKYMGPVATQELINLLKADFAKKQDIIQFVELPSPVSCVGRTYQYVGETNMYFQQGHFYHSNGFNWSEVYKGLDGKTWQIVQTVPFYETADFDTIYFVYKEDGKVEGYIKGPEKMDLITTTNSWKLVSALPAWNEATTDTIYFIIDRGRLQGFVKNEAETDSWYELGGKVNYNELDNTPIINGIPTKNTLNPDEPTEIVLEGKIRKYPDSVHWDKDAVYPDEPETFPVNELYIKAFTDNEIEQLFDEAGDY